MAQCDAQFDLNFVRYAQSNKCKTNKDSSVSYASAVVRLAEEKGKKRRIGKNDKQDGA